MRKKTKRQRSGASFLCPILESSIAPVLSGIIRKIFRMMYVKKKEAACRKTKKDTELKEDDIKKMVLWIRLHLLQLLKK